MSDQSHNKKSALCRMPRNDATARDCNGSNMQLKQIVGLKYMLCNEVVYQKYRRLSGYNTGNMAVDHGE
jgi:hypothetical protein